MMMMMTSGMQVNKNEAVTSECLKKPVLRCKIENNEFKCVPCNVSMKSDKPFSFHLWKHLHGDLRCKSCERNNIDPKTVTEENIQCTAIQSVIEKLKYKLLEKQRFSINGKISEKGSKTSVSLISNTNVNSISENKLDNDETDGSVILAVCQQQENVKSGSTDNYLANSIIKDSDSFCEDTSIFPAKSLPLSKTVSFIEDGRYNPAIESRSEVNESLETSENSRENQNLLGVNSNDHDKEEDPSISNICFTKESATNEPVRPLEIIKAVAMNIPINEEMSESSEPCHVPSKQTETEACQGDLPMDTIHCDEDAQNSQSTNGSVVVEKVTSHLDRSMKCSFSAGKYTCESCNITKSFHRAFAYHAWKHVHSKECEECEKFGLSKHNSPIDVKCPIVISMMESLKRNGTYVLKNSKELITPQKVGSSGISDKSTIVSDEENAESDVALISSDEENLKNDEISTNDVVTNEKTADLGTNEAIGDSNDTHIEEEMDFENTANDQCEIFPDPDAECCLVIQSVYSQADDPENQIVMEEENEQPEPVAMDDSDEEAELIQRNTEITSDDLTMQNVELKPKNIEIPSEEQSDELTILLCKNGDSSVFNPELDPKESIDLISKIGIDAIMKGIDGDLTKLIAVTCKFDEPTVPSPNPVAIEEYYCNDIAPSHTNVASNVTKLEQAKGYFTCGFVDCSFSCTSETNFKTHLTDKHDDSSFPCVFCCCPLPTNNDLVLHMKSHQSAAKNFMLYCCSLDCRYCTNNARQFKLHLDMCHPTKETYPCSFCKEQFDSANMLISHLTSGLVKLVHCPYCFVRSVSKLEVMNHMRRMHPSSSNRIVVTSRMCCQEHSSSVSSPNQVEEKMLDCGACGFQTSDVDSLKQHIQKCEKAKNFHQFMARKNNQDTEENLKEVSKKLEAVSKKSEVPVVSKSPPRKSVGGNNESISDEKHRCPECNNGFSSPKHLMMHIKCYHKGEILLKSEACNYCNESSHNCSWIVQHSKDAHPGMPVKYSITEHPITCDNVTCEKCSFMYKRNSYSSYINHCIEMHFSDKEFLESVKNNHPLILQSKPTPTTSNAEKSIESTSKRQSFGSSEIDSNVDGSGTNENANLLCCSFCYKTFHIVDEFKYHIATHFSGNRQFILFKCQNCDFYGTSKIFIRNHLRDNHPLKPPRMELLTVSVTGLSNDKNDIGCDRSDETKMLNQSSEKSNAIQCFYCDESFSNDFFFHKHIYSTHQQEELQMMKNQIIQCMYCSYKTQFEYKMRYHIRSDHKREKYKVIRKVFDLSLLDKSIQGKKEKVASTNFDDANIELSASEYTKNGQNKFKCKKCSLTLEGPLSLMKKHFLDEHAKDCQYQCKYCTFTSLDHSNVSQHGQNTHKQVGIVLCCVTEKPRNDRASAKRKRSTSHESEDQPSKTVKIEDGKGRDSPKVSEEEDGLVETFVKTMTHFRCDHCRYSHVDCDTVQRHLLEKHPQFNQKAFKKVQVVKNCKRFKCKYCDYSSEYSLRDLGRHIQRRHTDETQPDIEKKKYSCDSCTFQADQLEILKSHQKEKHHKEKVSAVSKSERVIPQKLKTIKLENGGYKCHDCDFKDDKDYVKRHYASVHLKLQSIYGCSLCPYVTTLMAHAKIHGSSVHKSDNAFAVQQLKVASIVASLAKRSKKQTKVKNETTNEKSSAQKSSHKESSSPQDKRAQHDLSDEALTKLFARRLVFVEGELKPPFAKGDMFKCHYCNFESPVLINVEKHLINHGPYRFKCHYCVWKGFSVKNAKRHCKVKHPNEKPVCIRLKQKTVATKLPDVVTTPDESETIRFQCIYCKIFASNLAEIRQHLTSIHAKRVLKIGIHGKDSSPEYKHIENWIFNVNRNSNGFYRCKFCTFKTKMGISMKKHLANHFHLFNCEYCDYSAPFKFNLNCHIAKKHSSCPLQPHPAISRMTNYCCIICPTIVRSELDFVTHLASEHSDVFTTTNKMGSFNYVNVQPMLLLKSLEIV